MVKLAKWCSVSLQKGHNFENTTTTQFLLYNHSSWAILYKWVSTGKAKLFCQITLNLNMYSKSVLIEYHKKDF